MEGSYKAKLLGEIPGAYEQAFEFDREMDTGVESDDDISDLSRVSKLDCVSLRKDFFLVIFSLKEDYVNVLKVAIWIWLLELPIKYYEPSALREIGEAIGRF
uniref:DUF4283 domain-containing protein n=1 Tax=Quercus lobata TaxID=97700 RepID=A0A7N2N4N0_QUELO